MGRDGRTVLIVDDDRINRSLLSTLLENEGYQPRTAVNGRDALTALAEDTFDAVLLDMVMPEVDGMEVLRTIKADPRLWRIPVIVISALEEIDSIVACLDLGADDYVQKPFDPVLLRARLNACLARRQFHDLEVEYQKMLEEQAAELEELRQADEPGTASRFLGEARQAEVVVVVAGLDGLEGGASHVSPSEAFRLLGHFHASVDRLVDRFRGVLTDVGADTATILFERGERCPDPATAAVALARELGAELGGGALVCATGVATGQATVGPVRNRLAAIGAPVERAVNLRRRAGRHGGVLIDEETAAGVGQFGEAELVSIENDGAPAVAHRLPRPDGPGGGGHPVPPGDHPAATPPG